MLSLRLWCRLQKQLYVVFYLLFGYFDTIYFIDLCDRYAGLFGLAPVQLPLRRLRQIPKSNKGNDWIGDSQRSDRLVFIAHKAVINCSNYSRELIHPQVKCGKYYLLTRSHEFTCVHKCHWVSARACEAHHKHHYAQLSQVCNEEAGRDRDHKNYQRNLDDGLSSQAWRKRRDHQKRCSPASEAHWAYHCNFTAISAIQIELLCPVMNVYCSWLETVVHSKAFLL